MTVGKLRPILARKQIGARHGDTNYDERHSKLESESKEANQQVYWPMQGLATRRYSPTAASLQRRLRMSFARSAVGLDVRFYA